MLDARTEGRLEHIPVTMVRPHLQKIPRHPVPDGFALRKFRAADKAHWAEVEASVGEFESAEAAAGHFEREFGDHLAEMETRCLLLLSPAGEVIGTTTAWWSDNSLGEAWGRIHWVAIRPEWQGRKLAKPMVTAAMRILARHHDRAYLTTQTTSSRAIALYADLGFRPLIHTPTCQRAWRLLADVLERPSLLQCWVSASGESPPESGL